MITNRGGGMRLYVRLYDRRNNIISKFLIVVLYLAFIHCGGSETVVKTQEAIISINPLVIEFGQVEVGKEKQLPFIIQNIGGKTLSITSITTNLPTNFVLPAETVPLSIEPSERKTLSLSFRPLEKKKYTATLIILSSDKKFPLSNIQLTGEGITENIVTDEDGGDIVLKDDDNDLPKKNDSDSDNDTITKDDKDEPLPDFCPDSSCLQVVECAAIQPKELSINANFISDVIWAAGTFHTVWVDSTSKKYQFSRISLKGEFENTPIEFTTMATSAPSTPEYASMIFSGKRTGVTFVHNNSIDNKQTTYFSDITFPSGNPQLGLERSVVAQTGQDDNGGSEIAYNGEFFGIVYKDDAGKHIYYSKLKSDGEVIVRGKDLDLSGLSFTYINDPQITSDGTNFYILFTRNHKEVTENKSEIYGLVIDADGNIITSAKQISPSASQEALTSEIVYIGKSFAIIWLEADGDTNTNVMYYLIDTALNGILSSPVDVSKTAGEHAYPHIAFNGSNIAISFGTSVYKEPGNKKVVSGIQISILNSQTGNEEANYKIPDTFGFISANSIVAPMGKNGFAFLWKAQTGSFSKIYFAEYCH